jgi:glucosyl-3-phosphoglycerate synthase
LTQFFPAGPNSEGFTQHTLPVSLDDRPPMSVLRPH